MRAVAAIIVAFAALLQSVAAQPTAPVDAPAPYDKTCFELPIVIVSPIDERLPTETCNQQRYPAIDCMKKPVAVNLEVIDNANGTLNCLNGPRTATYPSTAHYRGQSSLHFSKHQMSVKLDEASEFLGFPADQKFVLNGPVIDSTLMRNHLAQWLFRQTTRYSPRSRHIVVFIRDRLDTADNTPAYKGIYLALEKISYGPNRVGLAPLSNECKGSELNGGWAWQNNPLNYGVYSPNIVHDKYQIMFGSGERPVLMYPGAKVLTQSMRDYFVDTKTGPLPRMYEYLYENMTNTKGFEEVIDIGSFVDYFLHSEMSQNSDAYRRSTYFFKDRDQPINAGPVWDFNLAYGTGANQKDWLYKPHTFWKRLFCNYKFASLVPKRWRELRASVWSDETISYFLGNSSAPIARQLEHCSSWTSSNLQCANTNGGGTFMGNVDSLERTVLARAHWMDDHVAGFYMKLNFTVCEPAGPIPTYNCAEDGDDDGCLTNPEKYINAVEFPSIRKPSEDKPCASASAPGASNEAVEEPSIDPCWLSAGVYVKDGSITPFCSGYGSCPPGPGAKCMCTQGRKLPTCARSDDPITVPDLKIAAHASGNSAAHSWTRTSEVLAFMGVMVAMCGLFVFLRNRREKKRQATMYPPVLEGLAARDQGTSLHVKHQLCVCVFAFVTLQVCFELPIVIVSPTNTRLPKDSCLQKPPPSLDCMKEPVEAIVEVVDHADGSPNCFLDARTSVRLSSVHYRGQSSLHFSKHQMGVTLSEPTTFLGFPADRQFVLNGPMIDSTLLRNHLAHWLFRQTTRYSPRTRHVVLYVRDREDPTDFTPDYKGIYLALEKISYGPNRVGLAPLDNTCHGSELSGGWAWQINPLNYGVYSPNIVRDQYETAFGSGERPVLTYPRPTVLTQSMRDYFVDTKTSPLSQLYKYLYENMTSPDELETHVDIGSFVDYFLHSEMSQNTDAYRRSTYFFKDRDQQINAGPVWDFNLAYGTGANQKDWLYKPHTFWKRLFCNYKFASLVQKRWRELRAKLWSDLAIHTFIHESAAPIHRQLQKCANWTSADLYCANVQVGGTYHENVHALATTVANRAKWMDENVHQFYMKLNESVCVPLGTLPAFNCAANGSDDGCLEDPKKYIDAVEFPEVRKPSPSTPCAKFTGGDDGGGSGNGTLEPPSIDPCWLSVGANVAQSSLMSFCSGYGFCEPGPAATCKCVPGYQPPTCADPNAHNPVQVMESKAFASPSELQPLSPQPIVLSEYFMWISIVALMCVVCGCVSLYYRKKNCRIDDATSSTKFADARNVAVHYGT